MAVEVFAPAKVNLALHVTGRRADGYHLLDSLVVFAGVGDRLRATPAAHLALSVTGPEAAGLADGVTRTDNLVLRAARLFDRPPGLRLTLDKHLPVASGIGGGSADAAAALRLVAAMTGQAMPAAEAVLTLGADVPVCLAGRPARIGGIGERIEPCAALPKGAALVLVNPRIPLSTPSVFAALATRENPPLPSLPTRFATFAELSGWLAQGRNDLEAPARGLVPAIGGVLDSLGAAGAPLARMSGSGATCFGLFADLAAGLSGDFNSLEGGCRSLLYRLAHVVELMDSEGDAVYAYAPRDPKHPEDFDEMVHRAYRNGLAKARDEFANITKDEALSKFLNHGASLIKWQAFRTACIKMLTLIGVSVVASMAGGAAASAVTRLVTAGGAEAVADLSLGARFVAGAANVTADAAVNAIGQRAVMGTGIGEGFLENLIQSAGSMAILGALERDAATVSRLEENTTSIWKTVGHGTEVILRETAVIRRVRRPSPCQPGNSAP